MDAGAKNDVILKVMNIVLKAEDENGRQHMKSMLSGLLKTFAVSKEILNQLCQNCLTALIERSKGLVSVDESKADEVAALKSEIDRQADNLLWVVDIMIDKNMGREVVKVWADQKELSELYQKIPHNHRYNISRITAHICTSLTRGSFFKQAGEAKYSLLDTWLEILYADFEWMTRHGIKFDRNFVEEGLCRFIGTLTKEQEQSIVMDWSTRFANKGDNCPHLQKAFELWWRRVIVYHNLMLDMEFEI